MKALASEITRKLGKRLEWLNVTVKELTGKDRPLAREKSGNLRAVVSSLSVGDMQLTRAEIAETQIIVTTPEKWDVVTRKPTGEGELASVKCHSKQIPFEPLVADTDTHSPRKSSFSSSMKFIF